MRESQESVRLGLRLIALTFMLVLLAVYVLGWALSRLGEYLQDMVIDLSYQPRAYWAISRLPNLWAHRNVRQRSDSVAIGPGPK